MVGGSVVVLQSRVFQPVQAGVVYGLEGWRTVRTVGWVNCS